MKLSISNIAWAKTDDLKMYEYVAQQGFQGIEIAPTRIFEDNPYDKLQEAEDFAKQLKNEYGLEISSMQSIWFGKTQKIFGSQEERNELIEYTKKARRLYLLLSQIQRFIIPILSIHPTKQFKS